MREARGHLENGRIAERARRISKAHAILSHLAGSLDRTRGAQLSRNLAGLYDYMQRQLLEANAQQQAEPLREVENLLTTLLDGWNQAGAAFEGPAGGSVGTAGKERIEEERETGTLGNDAAVENQGAIYSGYATVPASMNTEYAPQSWSL